MNFFKYSFNEDEWVVYLIDEDDNVIADENAVAETSFEKKEVYFRKTSGLNLSTVLHEIWHIYFGYCYLHDTTDMTLSDIEEVSAEMFSDKAERMIERSKIILDKLEELKFEADLEDKNVKE